jgi:K+-sensing histidine kinase KdpD
LKVGFALGCSPLRLDGGKLRLAVPIVANTLQPRGMISLSRGLPTIRIVNVARGSILMLRSRVNWGMSAKFWHSAAQCFFGGIGLVFLAFVCFLLGLNLAAAGFAFLILIALLALIGGFIGSVVLSIVAVGCLNYFFTLPLFSFRVDYPQDMLALTAFLLTATVRKMAEEA